MESLVPAKDTFSTSSQFHGGQPLASPAHWNYLGVVQEHSDSPAILMWFVRMQSRCSGYAKFSLMIVS